VKLEKRDEDFTQRNAMQAVTLEEGNNTAKILLFGGQDSEDER